MTPEAIGAYCIDAFEAGSPPGKFTDLPTDLGGPTRWGITKRGLADFLRTPARAITTDQIRAVTRELAIEVFVELAIMRPNLARVTAWQPLLVTADFNFNAGADDGIPALQRAVHTAADGICGPLTLAKVNAYGDPVRLAVRAVAYRQRVHVARAKGAQIANLRGWMNRCTALLVKVAP
jgi:lysozyme family protein